MRGRSTLGPDIKRMHHSHNRNPSAPTLEHLHILAQIAFLATSYQQDTCHFFHSLSCNLAGCDVVLYVITHSHSSEMVRICLYLVRTGIQYPELRQATLSFSDNFPTCHCLQWGLIEIKAQPKDEHTGKISKLPQFAYLCSSCSLTRSAALLMLPPHLLGRLSRPFWSSNSPSGELYPVSFPTTPI